jgi:hypothetical protein
MDSQPTRTDTSWPDAKHRRSAVLAAGFVALIVGGCIAGAAPTSSRVPSPAASRPTAQASASVPRLPSASLLRSRIRQRQEPDRSVSDPFDCGRNPYASGPRG